MVLVFLLKEGIYFHKFLSNNIRRPSIDLCFVLDVSGSMGSPFPSDSDRRSKLDVSKSCLLSILSKLTESDRISIIQFDDRQELLFPLQHVTSGAIRTIEEILSKINSRGGTNLGAGIASGFKHLSESTIIAPPDENATDIRQRRTKRVVFMTDMESSAADETTVINLSQDAVRGIITTPAPQVRSMFASVSSPIAAEKKSSSDHSASISPNAIFTTVIGIGVDLSVRTVERICAISGARYISAINASEFMSTVADEFPYDISPVAFNIRVTLPASYTINKVYGASELNSVPNESTTFTISSEFANPLDTLPTDSGEVEYQMKGGILLIRLNEENKHQHNSKRISWDTPAESNVSNTPRRSTRNKPAPSESPLVANDDRSIVVEWTDLQNVERTLSLPLDVPNPLVDDEDVSLNCDEGLIKAVTLMTYVDYMERYATSPEKPLLNASSHNAEVLQPFLELSLHELIELPSLEALPCYPSIPSRISLSHQTIRQFQNMKAKFIKVFNQLLDQSLFTTNQNILQTIQQVIELETKELQDDIKDLKRQLGYSQPLGNVDEKDCPHSYLCPISLTLMKDPVIACDGHSYERESITKWFESHNTSPVTNLPLPSQMLIDNHTLKGAIEEYLSTMHSNTPDKSLAASVMNEHASPTRTGRGGRAKRPPTNSPTDNSGRKRNR